MSYTLTLHKKSYLLKGISKDDPNKEAVKAAGAKWNGSLSGWLFFPKQHKDGLKLAKKIGAEINIEQLDEEKEEKTPKKESKRSSKNDNDDDESKGNEEFLELKRKYDKLKGKYKKMKKEKQKLEDRIDRMSDKFGALGESDCEDEDLEH